MADKRRFFWIALKLFIVLISLLCLSVISAIITMKLVSRADFVKVPSIVGKDTVEALEQLNKIGLRLKILGQEFSESVPLNHIVSQEPKPFELIARDRAINVVLSRGSEKVDVPVIVDEPWLRAQSIIQGAGLKIGRLVRTHHQEIKENRVIAQNPAGKSMVSRGFAIDLLLSDGKPPREYIMPELKGSLLGVALRKIDEVEMSPGKITYQYNADIPPNTIVAQIPKAGFKTVAGTKVDLLVSKIMEPDAEEVGIYTTLNYHVPEGSEERDVTIVLKEGDYMKEIFHEVRPGGSAINLLIKTSRHSKALIYLDNVLTEEKEF